MCMRSFCIRETTAVVLALSILSAPVIAQDPPPPQDQKDPVFIVGTKRVVAPTTVTDKNGNPINGLRVEDFMLFDKGKPQAITEDQTSHPLSLVILIQVCRMLEVDAQTLWRRALLRPLLGMVGLLPLWLGLARVMPPTGWLNFVALIGIGVFLYAGLALLLEGGKLPQRCFAATRRLCGAERSGARSAKS